MSTLETPELDATATAQSLPNPISDSLSTSLTDSLRGVLGCTHLAEEFLLSFQRESLYWCAELESNPTITAEYVFLCQILSQSEGHPPGTLIRLEQGRRKDQLILHLIRQQKTDGGWGIAINATSDISTTAETYLALRILGLEIHDPVLTSAENYIVANGGLEKVRIFTRIFFAMFGLVPWRSIPALPPEFMLLPPKSGVNIYSLASWARGTMIPLFVIFHHKPVYALPNGRDANNDWLDHLWLNKTDKEIPYMPSAWELLRKKGISFEAVFGTADWALKCYEPMCIGPIRKRAIDKCISYIIDHQEDSGDWGGIFPPMINGVIALILHGHSLDSEPVRKGLKAIENFSWEDDTGFRIQACVSPVWDTALSLIALLDCGVSPNDPRLKGAARWLLNKQINFEHGDWKVNRPHLKSGGWSFEYHNTWYPDIDDTAAVLLALLKQNPESIFDKRVNRAIGWVVGMQNRDGGWAAFDVENDKLYMNRIPFSDMESLCDTSCPDITGRVLEAFGYYLKLIDQHSGHLFRDLKKKVLLACEKGIRYLRHTQEQNGSWFGRWGVNYVYGTSNVLCGLAQMPVSEDDPMVARALSWFEVVQNPDGGWGESLESYAKNRFVAQNSTASQTGWALMGQLAYLPSDSEPIRRGIDWLIANQVPAPLGKTLEGGKPVPMATGGTWEETESTGTGFPNHFYLRYHLYRHYFPMMALGRYLKLRET